MDLDSLTLKFNSNPFSLDTDIDDKNILKTAYPVLSEINNASSKSFSSAMNVSACGFSQSSLPSLPNFLGLDSSSSHVNLPSSCDDDSILSSLPESPSTIFNTLQRQGLQSDGDFDNIIEAPPENNPAFINNNGVNITTISISNDDINSTKITVDTNEGEPQMYIIDTSSLTAVQNCNNVNVLPSLL